MKKTMNFSETFKSFFGIGIKPHNVFFEECSAKRTAKIKALPLERQQKYIIIDGYQNIILKYLLFIILNKFNNSTIIF